MLVNGFDSKKCYVKAKQIMFQSSVTLSPIMSTAEKRTAEDDKEEVICSKLDTLLIRLKEAIYVGILVNNICAALSWMITCTGS